MMLCDLIAYLESADQTKTVRIGFSNPHSYRGYYHDLAFEPVANIRVSEMLAAAKSALGTTYQGYKGGDYTMGEYTDCWLANYGETGEGIGPVLLGYMLSGGQQGEV